MVTVADLLARAELGLRVVAGGTSAALRWVATSELEDPAAFLEGGELLLTTGLGSGTGGGQDWPAWLERLAGAGVGAVGFGTGLSHERVPAPLVAAAARRGVALLEVPPATPFIAVSEALADLLRSGESAAEAAAAQAQRDLAVAAGGPDGTGRLLAVLGRATAGTAWLVDERGAVLRAGGPGPLPAGTAAVVRRLRPRALLASHTDLSPTGSVHVRAVGAAGAAGAPHAWLVLSAAPEPARARQAVVGTAAALLGVLLEQERCARRERARWAGCAVELLLAGHVGAAADVLASAPPTAPPADPPALPAVLRLLHVRGGHEDGGHEDGGGGSAGAPDPADLPALPAGALVAVLPRRGDVLVLCPEARDAPAACEAALSGAGLRVGTGLAVPPAGAALGEASARAAAARTGAGRPVVRADEPGATALAARWGGDGLRAWAAEVLHPLERLPPAEAADLRAAGHAFLAHHGQRLAAASALGVHRNTLRHRLARLEQVLGRSLDVPQDRAELWLALDAPTGAPAGARAGGTGAPAGGAGP